MKKVVEEEKQEYDLDIEEVMGKKPEKKRSLAREILSDVGSLLIVVLVVLFVNRFILINAKIPTSSMENTIMVNDQIFGSRLAYRNKGPERFDIIIFRYPDDPTQLFIKRVIGLPGETLEIRDGKVYVDGSDVPLDDSFIREEATGDFGPYTVPADCYFVMGDNRNNSNDSRMWVNTYVPRDEILGKAYFRYWPLNKMGLVE